MKDQAQNLATSISGPNPRRVLRTALAGAVATVTAGSLLLAALPSVPAPHAPDGSHGPAAEPRELVESVPVVRSETTPADVSPAQVLAVLERAERQAREQGPDLSRAVAQAVAELGMRGAPEGQHFSVRESLLDVVTTFGGSALGYANGRIPAAVLCPLEFAPGHMLRCDAAERLTALSDEFEREFGYPIPITDSYRTYVQQIALATVKPHLAAVPGTSNHGWGLAVDLSDPIAGGTSPEYVWLRVHGPDYGWDNPSWARLGGAKPEPWHFEFFAAGSMPNRAIAPSDVDTWDAARPTGSSDDKKAGSPRHKAAADTRPKDRPAAGEAGTPARKPADELSAVPSAQKPSKPSPKPEPTPTKPKPTAPPGSPVPSPSPSLPSPGPAVPSSPSPSPTPPPPNPEPSALPSPAPSEPTPSEPTPDSDAPPTPSPSPSVSVSSGPLSGLAKELGLAVAPALAN